jgi:hypothetical protein
VAVAIIDFIRYEKFLSNFKMNYSIDSSNADFSPIFAYAAILLLNSFDALFNFPLRCHGDVSACSFVDFAIAGEEGVPRLGQGRVVTSKMKANCLLG